MVPLVALAPAALGAQRGTEAAELERIDDLRSLAARMQRERIPLLLFFSTAGCPYCIEVRRNYLAPRLKENAGSLLIREVEIVSRRSFTGLDGKAQNEAGLAARFGVRMVPVVQLVDARLAPIGKPLVGLDPSGFYDAYLSAAIEDAQRLVKGP
jgi:thioredoxin-related protein